MNRWVAATLAALAGFGAGGGVQPAGEAPAMKAETDPGLLRDLEALDAKGAQVRDLTAQFEQEKFTALLKKPLVSSGRVRVRDGTARWDTERPRRSVLVIKEAELRLYDPEAATLEIYPADASLGGLTASPVPRLAAVKDRFTLERISPDLLDARATEESALAVGLKPREGPALEHISGVRVLIDRKTGCASVVEVTDADGERTVIRFSRLELNTGLTPADIELEVPPGTEVLRPLDPAPPADGKGPE